MDGSRLYNLDETSTSIVQNTRKIICSRSSKQVYQLKSAERGTSVTTCCIIGAYGIILPPVIIFPRVYFKSNMIINSFPGTLGLANEKGYMTKDTFLKVMEHFMKCTVSSRDAPTLLLVDNVETHLSAAAIDYAREHGVTIFTFPPHCTHKLQPLDIGIFGPFKTYYDNAINSWMMSNLEVPVIYHIAGFVREALSKAATSQNIIKSFEKPGIFPFNNSVFQESDHVMATVTEQPDPNEATISNSNEIQESDVQTELQSESNRSDLAIAEPSLSNCSTFISPTDFKEYPKIQTRQKIRKPRRKGKYMIATDTPEKNQIQEREEQQMEKKRNTEKRKKQDGKKTKEKQTEKTKEERRSVQKILQFNESDSENNVSRKVRNLDYKSVLKTRSPDEGDYVLVLFTGKYTT